MGVSANLEGGLANGGIANGGIANGGKAKRRAYVFKAKGDQNESVRIVTFEQYHTISFEHQNDMFMFNYGWGKP